MTKRELFKNRIENAKKNNSGFTLVELVVVLLLMGILLTVTVFGGLAWQDWAQFRHEEAMAEEMFFAAQNQITELDSSGALDKVVTKKISDADGIRSDYALTKSVVTSIYYKEVAGEQINYTWGSLWSNSNVTTPPKTMVTLRAKAGDYTKYLNGEFSNESSLSADDLGAKIIFDLIAPYVTDASALNGAIALEFSPDAGQVFSVSYSDRTDKLVYGSGDSYGSESGGASVDITKRVIQDREDVMLGYYSVENMTNKKRGKSFSSSDLFLTVDNSEVFSLVVEDKKSQIESGDDMVFTIYDGGNSGKKPLMTIKIPFDGVKGNLKDASSFPADATISFNEGLYKGQNDVPFRIPVYTLNKKIYVVLDAADIQAQTLSFSKSIYFNSAFDSDDEKAFRNTYSFYRFGLSQEVQYIYADLTVKTGDNEKFTTIDSYDEDEAEYHKSLDAPRGGCTAFESFKLEDGKYNIEIKNMRHFYNVRYETDYKYSIDSSGNTFRSNVYTLKNNISWKTFSKDYLLNSYKNTGVNSGISYGGGFPSTNIDTSDVDANPIPFPGFRKLDKRDTFTQKNAFGEEGHFTINDITVKLSSNIVYGVYGKIVKEACADESTSADTYASIIDSADSQADKEEYLAARAGELPLGLFAENQGKIENITLNRHQVIGAELVNNHFVYTCMVGGFVGNNLGAINKLVLLDSTDNAETTKDNRANESKVVGRMDVGGIIGRQSFTVLDDTKTVISGMKNYASVSGKEDVGGIVGRVYTNYVGENPDGFKTLYPNTTIGSGNNIVHVNVETQLPKYKLYLDGYSISDPSKDNYKKSMTGEEVKRNSSVEVTDCINRGRVSGDKLFYTRSIYKYSFSGNQSDAGICAFIGGIAGCTMDGRIYDARQFNINGNNAFLTLCASFIDGSSQTIKVSNCNSYYAYEGVNSYEDLIRNLTSIYGDSKQTPLSKDNYVGGLIGYAKLTAIENCNTEPDSSMTRSNGVSNTFVIGYRYVGGVVGCSDMSRFDNNGATQNTLTNKTYAATNYNNVIGRALVGGIAGAFGIGDTEKETFSYKTPSLNEASMVSPINELKNEKIDLIHNLLNKGCVLALNDEENNINQSIPTIDGVYLNPQIPVMSYNGKYECGYAGGIVGASRIAMNNCDSIQSESVKDYVMTLVTGTYTDYYNISAVDLSKDFDTTSKVKFGGKCVGGIAGLTSTFGKINETNGSKSYVDSVVFGRFYVGGAVGSVSFVNNNSTGVNSNQRTFDIRNVYPMMGSDSRGLLVAGESFVGGIAGKLEDETGIVYDNAIDSPYTVKGRAVVGGILGMVVQKRTNTVETKVSINITGSDHATVSGVGYVGGYAGCNNEKYFSFDGVANAEYDLNGVDVNAKCFAGGIIGLVTRGNDLSTVSNLVVGDNVSVYSECFAGGIVGLYTTETGDIANKNRDTNNRLYKIIRKVKDKDYQGIFDFVVDKDVNNIKDTDNREIFDQPKNSNEYKILFGEYSSYADDISTNDKYSNTISVSADLFAGGLFGYVPNGQKVTVEGFVNNGAINVNNNVTNVRESSNKSACYSYLGGVIGRVPSGMKLINCANHVSGPDYNSSNATTYLGGLTEVNAGVISGKVETEDQNGTTVTIIKNYLVNKTDYKYSSGGIGAFAGINGTTANGCAGVIQYARNEGSIASTNGFAGGMTAASDSASSVTRNLNLGDISGKEAAGIVARPSGSDTVSYCRNYGTISGTDKSYGIAAGVVGSIGPNLEASGLDNGSGNDPVADMDSTSLSYNFFIRGVYNPNGSSSSGSGSTDPVNYSVTNENNSGAKDTKITVTSPSTGLALDTFRVYCKFNTTDLTKKCNYLVSFTYTDGEGEEHTVYRYRTFTFTPAAEGDTEINASFYDDIAVVDMDSQPIKPTLIQIHVDDPTSVQITTDSFSYNKDVTTGTSSMCNDVDPTTIADYEVVSVSNEGSSSQTYESDKWSKRLIVKVQDDGTKNLSYKRNGIIQRNLMLTNKAIDVTVEQYNAYEKYNAYDAWFVDEFSGNPDAFGPFVE